MSAQANGGTTQQFVPVYFGARQVAPGVFWEFCLTKEKSHQFTEGDVHSPSAAITTCSVIYSWLPSQLSHIFGSTDTCYNFLYFIY